MSNKIINKILNKINENKYGIKYNFNELIDKLLDYYNIIYEHNLFNYMIETTDPSGMSGCCKFFHNILLIFDDRFELFDVSKTITERLKQIPLIKFNKCYSIKADFDLSEYIYIIEKQQNKKYVLNYSVYPFDLGGANMVDYHSEIIKLLNDICNIEYYKYSIDTPLDKTDNKLIILNNDYIYKKYNEKRIKINDAIYCLSGKQNIIGLLWFKYFNCIFFKSKVLMDDFEKILKTSNSLIKIDHCIRDYKYELINHFKDAPDNINNLSDYFLKYGCELITDSENYYNYID